MKGLLLKDFYMAAKYCRMFLLIILVFAGVFLAAKSSESFSASAFPVLFASMLPVTLLSYDEKEKWHIYSGTFPYSRAQIVSSKYVFGLIVTLVVLTLFAGVFAVRMNLSGSFTGIEFLSSVAGMFTAGFVGSALTLPFIFKFGAEKGRIMYFVVIIVIFGLGTALESMKPQMSIPTEPLLLLAVTVIGTVIVYAASWLLSIAFYQKRDL